MFVLANMWFQTLMRQFFFNIDKIVFNFISTIYDFLITIARTSVLSQADIIDMADRIYKLLAIFMIFKVTFSLIMYVVNPDDFSDKNKGVGKLGTNIVISLALLILTPYIFSYAYQLQTIILEDNSLSALIFGDAQENSTESPFESAGDSMAYITMAPFFTPNAAIDELYECAQLTTKDSNGKVVFNEACSGLNSNYESTNDTDSMYALVNDRFTEQTLKNYVAGVSVGNLGLMFRQDMAVATDEDNTEYIIDYKYLFSTVLGIVVVLLLVTFCMDVALRSIKLAFLQLVAPIPIISFVDPKSGKDGMFKKWAEMCVKTYISLFIRLLAIYFAAYIISRIDSMVDIIDGSYVSNLLVKIFIIIGALMFAKQLPKILEGLGIKLDGGFTLNPLKKMENEMLGGKTVSKTGKEVGKYAGRLGKGLGTAALVGGSSLVMGHGFRGTGTAMKNAWKGEKFGKNFSNSYGVAKAKHKERDEMEAAGVTRSDVMKNKWYNARHGETRMERAATSTKKMEAVAKSWDDFTGAVTAVDKEAKRRKAVVDGIKQAGTAAFTDQESLTAQQQYDSAVATKNSQISKLEERRKESVNKTSQIKIDQTRLRNEQSKLNRADFSSDAEFYEARANYTQRIAALDEELKQYDIKTLDQEINKTKAERDNLAVTDFKDIVGKSAADQYEEAIKKAEGDLDDYVNAVVDGSQKIYDGTSDGSAGGKEAEIRVANIKAARDKLIAQINAEQIEYVDGAGQQQVIEIGMLDQNGKPLSAKAIAKGTVGKKNAWHSSSTYDQMESVARFTGEKK